MPDSYIKDRRRALGLCKDCGMEPAVPGHALGSACAEKGRLAWRAQRALDVATRLLKSCAHCGTNMGVDYKPRGGKPSKFCSRACNQQYQAVIQRAKSEQSRPAREALRQERQLIAERQKQERRLAAHLSTADCVCRVCGVGFTKPLFRPGKPTMCSPECRRKAQAKQRRTNRQQYGKKPADRARKRGLPYDRCGPIAVCTRDRWRCQLCGVSTPRKLRGTYHLRAPEVDHIVPLSDPSSPGHVWANVQCLCRACNIKKSNRTLGQLRLAVSC